MPEKTPVEFDDAMLERLERYIVQGDDGLRDAVLVQLVATHPGLIPQLRDILAALRMRSRDAAETSLAGAMRRLVREPVAGTQTSTRQKKEVFKTQPLRRTRWSIAAAFVVGIVMTVMSGYLIRQPTPASMLTYTTANGQRATITLPDGATVALNVASRLEVPLNYLTGNRLVRLTGEGVFTVPHQSGAPLTVLAGGRATRVLGTTFVVRRYATDTATMVSVQEGKVAVDGRAVVAGQMVVAGPHAISPTRPSDRSQFTFAAGILTINGVPLRDAIPDLERWYDVKIQLEDSTLAMHPLDGEFAAGSVSDLTTWLELAYRVHVVRTGRVLTLMPEA